MNLAWKTLKNSAWAIAEYAWPIVLALATAPYIVRTLGTEGYGLLSIVGVTVGFFGLLDLGIGAAATRQIAIYHGRDERDKIGLVVSTTAFFYLAVGLAGALVVMVLTGTLVTDVLDIPPELQDAATLAFYVSATAFPVSLVVSAFTAVPRAVQRFDVSTKLGVVFSTLGTLVTVSILALGGGVVAVLVGGLILGLVALPVCYVIVRRLLPDVRIRARIDGALLRQLFSFGGYYFLSTVGALLLYQLDKFLIGAFLGVGSVTYYVVPSNLAQRIQGFTAAAVAVVFPVSAALLASQEGDALRRLYVEGSRLVFILIVAVGVPLGVFSGVFLTYWMGPEIAAESTTTMVILVATYALLSTTGMAWSIANGSGRARINSMFTLGIFVVDIALFLVLIEPFGVPGAAAAYLISALLGAPMLVSYVERRVLGFSGAEFLRIFWRIGIVGAIQIGIGFGLRELTWDLWSALGLMAVDAALFFPVYWGLGFMREGDRRLLSLLTEKVRGSGYS